MGKTKFTKELIRHKCKHSPWLCVYHLDTKKLGDFSNRDGIMVTSEFAPPPLDEPGSSMIWQPLYDDETQYNKFFHGILRMGRPAIVNIDECINMKFGTRIPRELAILAAQGRKPGIHIYSGTQQLAKSPRDLLSQATHIVSFHVSIAYDEREIMKALNIYEKGVKETLGLKEWEFYHRDTSKDDTATFYKTYQDFLAHIT